MPEFEFRDPWFLTGLLLIPLLLIIMVRRAESFVTYSTLSLIAGMPRTLRSRLAALPPFLMAPALAATVVAMAGPRTGDEETRVRREGIAIMMVVDRSSSMDARDLVPDNRNINRLDVVLALFNEFVLGADSDSPVEVSVNGGGRPDDVVGLVAFARYADGLCPLTLDHGNLAGVVSDLHIVTDRNEDGTALGEGLSLAVERLREHPARSKVVILLTDGQNNAGDITPRQAAQLAAEHNVKVYGIGAGTKGVAPMPAKDRRGRTVFVRAEVNIDEKTLRMIAQETGGLYFRATDAENLANIYRQIDKLERTEIAEIRYMDYHEWYPAFAWAALSCITCSTLLSSTLLRRLP